MQKKEKKVHFYLSFLLLVYDYEDKRRKYRQQTNVRALKTTVHELQELARVNTMNFYFVVCSSRVRTRLRMGGHRGQALSNCPVIM
jgi:hypothetical protein